MRARLLVIMALAFVPLSLVRAQNGPPPTAVRVVTDTFFDTTVTDPYRWLENLQDSGVVGWLHAQADYTTHVLDAIPGRAELQARVHVLSNAGPVVGAVQFGGTRIFYLKRRPGEELQKLYVRERFGAPERLLVDPERLRQAGGPHWAVDYFTPSFDGRFVAYGASPGGSENSILRVLDVTTGKLLRDSIDRVQFGGPAWRPDGRSFFYNRLQRLAPGAPVTEKYRRSRVYLHELGQSDSSDVAVLGIGVAPQVSLAEDDFPYVGTFPGSPWAVAGVAHGVQNEVTLFVAQLAEVHDSAAAWRPFVAVSDSVTGFDVHGDDVYLLTHDHAPRYKVLRTSLGAPDLAHAAVVVPETQAVVTNLGAAHDALYVQFRDAGLARLERRPYDASGGPVALPYEGAINGFATAPSRDGVAFSLESWTHSALWFALDPTSGKVTDTALQPPATADFSAITAEEVRVPAEDGTLVPLSIVRRRDLARVGTNPTLLDGYGAYGISYDPAFDARRLAWLERGGIFAVCHDRGGGEFGEGWHQAGRGASKAHTWGDFIACAEYLVHQRWTTPSRLAGTGTSAGGIEIGMAVDERPDLFGAAVPRVGEANPLRGMVAGVSGPANRPEFGDPTTVEGFHNLLAMDAYQHVRSGTGYPAMLLTAGMNDPRVDTWAPAKMAARLQAATSSGRPVLLRIEFEAGHGFGSTVSQRDIEFGDMLAFLLWQFGVAGFQPAGP